MLAQIRLDPTCCHTVLFGKTMQHELSPKMNGLLTSKLLSIHQAPIEVKLPFLPSLQVASTTFKLCEKYESHSGEIQEDPSPCLKVMQPSNRSILDASTHPTVGLVVPEPGWNRL